MITLLETVKYSFLPNELVQIARDQARHHSSLRQLEEEFDNIKADNKSKVTRLEADISDCTRRIVSGYEMRPTKCLVLKFRPDKDSALVVRADNGRVLRKRKLEPEEKQITLTTESEVFAFEADFYQDTESDIAEMVAEAVPLTEKEAAELREVMTIRPTRRQIEGKQ